MQDLVTYVENWATEKDLHIQDPSRQFMKFIEETGELASSIVKDDKPEIVDAFGDVLVTLIILNQQLREHGVISQEQDLDYCLEVAYDEIKNRTGKLVDGTFIKDN